MTIFIMYSMWMRPEYIFEGYPYNFEPLPIRSKYFRAPSRNFQKALVRLFGAAQALCFCIFFSVEWSTKVHQTDF